MLELSLLVPSRLVEIVLLLVVLEVVTAVVEALAEVFEGSFLPRFYRLLLAELDLFQFLFDPGLDDSRRFDGPPSQQVMHLARAVQPVEDPFKECVVPVVPSLLDQRHALQAFPQAHNDSVQLKALLLKLEHLLLVLVFLRVLELGPQGHRDPFPVQGLPDVLRQRVVVAVVGVAFGHLDIGCPDPVPELAFRELVERDEEAALPAGCLDL